MNGIGGNSTKAYALWKSAVRYFECNPVAFATLRRIISDKKKNKTVILPSLRCILYYITKYVQAHSIVFSDCGASIDVYERYRQMLRVHTKHLFDPFCRRTRHDLVLHGEKIQTNVGQLVFFKWFIDVGAYSHLLSVYDDVLSEMKSRNRKHPRTKTYSSATETKKHKLFLENPYLRQQGNGSNSNSSSSNSSSSSSSIHRVVVRLAVHNTCNHNIRIAVHLD